MSLSKKWEDQQIYTSVKKCRDLTKCIYRCLTTGLEAFVIDQDEDTYLIEGNGVRCRVWKRHTKKKLCWVEEGYVLRKIKR